MILFIQAINNMNKSINSYGANLLIRNFEYIKDNFNYDNKFYLDENENNKFLKSIYYCVNYIKLLTINDNKVNELLNKYYQIIPYDKNYVKPLLDLKKISKKNNQIINDNNQVIKENINEDEDYNSFL